MAFLHGEALVDAARKLAAEAHHDQVDKQGRDYFTHHLEPVATLLRPFGPFLEASGYLHDILEDTEVTEDDLRRFRFPDYVINAVTSVTKYPDETYDEMIERAGLNEDATLVKLADNWVNSSTLDQLAETNPAAANRLRYKYQRAREQLLAAAWPPDPEPDVDAEADDLNWRVTDDYEDVDWDENHDPDLAW